MPDKKQPTIDLVIAPIEMTWPQLTNLVQTAEKIGIGAIRVWDHLTGESEDSDRRCMECWTLLSALAPLTNTIILSPMVINPLHRDPATLAVMIATLQEISGDRLEIGIGAGTGPGGINSREQEVLGRKLKGAKARRALLESYITQIREIWSGQVPHYKKLDTPPPLFIGGFGPKMATIAGDIADGFVTSAIVPEYPELITLAKQVTTRRHYPIILTDEFDAAAQRLEEDPDWLNKLRAKGVDRLALTVHHADSKAVNVIEQFAAKIKSTP